MMTREELRAVFLSAADRAWEGSYAGHPLVYVAACDTAGHDNGDEITWHDGRPAIVINHGAVLLPEITDVEVERYGFEARDASAGSGWSRQAAGEQDKSNLFSSREEAEAELPRLAECLGYSIDDVRVVRW